MDRTTMNPPAAVPAAATVGREADALVFRGALLRPAVAALWRQAQPLRAGIRTLDLGAVSDVDSAGLALLAALAGAGDGGCAQPAARDAGDRAPGHGIAVIGAPAGLAELRAAYRLDARLAFAS